MIVDELTVLLKLFMAVMAIAAFLCLSAFNQLGSVFPSLPKFKYENPRTSKLILKIFLSFFLVGSLASVILQLEPIIAEKRIEQILAVILFIIFVCIATWVFLKTTLPRNTNDWQTNHSD